jgi:hypothetical protein
VAFEVRIDPLVIAFLNARDYLSDSDRERIVAGMTEELGGGADHFSEQEPLAHFENLFWYRFGLMTEAREYREFAFVCNAEGHVYGVTEVLYAEEQQEEDP